MIMKKHIISCIAFLLPAVSCQKIWEEDIRERTIDSIRGYYEIQSGIWEGEEPIDIDGDGIASFDYYDEWNRVSSGIGDHGAWMSPDGFIEIPYTFDGNADWGGPVSLSRHVLRVGVKIDVIIEGEEGRLQFRFPKDQDVVFEHTGYGEFTIRKEVTFTIQKGERETDEISGPVYFHFKRVSYFTE